MSNLEMMQEVELLRVENDRLRTVYEQVVQAAGIQHAQHVQDIHRLKQELAASKTKWFEEAARMIEARANTFAQKSPYRAPMMKVAAELRMEGMKP